MCLIGEPDEYAQVWNVRAVVARKEHRCACCHAIIKVGEKHYRYASLYDGVWSVERGCAPCDRAADKFGEAHGRMSFFPSGFIDALVDCVDERDEGYRRWQRVLRGIRSRRAAT